MDFARLVDYDYVAAGGNFVDTVGNALGWRFNTWEDTRDVLAEKSFETFGSPGDTISTYSYSVNGLGQRTAVETAGIAFGSSPPDRGWDWGYNARGEVVKAVHADDNALDRAYAFDGIGNRTGATDGSGGGATTTSYIRGVSP